MPALRAINQPGRDRLWTGTVVAQQGKTLTVRRNSDSELLTYRHHDPERLTAALVLGGDHVAVNGAFGILRAAETDEGSLLFSVKRDTGGALGPCTGS